MFVFAPLSPLIPSNLEEDNHDSVMKEPHLLWLMSSSFEDANKWSTWDEDQQRCHAYLHLSTLEKCMIYEKIGKRSHAQI